MYVQTLDAFHRLLRKIRSNCNNFISTDITIYLTCDLIDILRLFVTEVTIKKNVS